MQFQEFFVFFIPTRRRNWTWWVWIPANRVPRCSCQWPSSKSEWCNVLDRDICPCDPLLWVHSSTLQLAASCHKRCPIAQVPCLESSSISRGSRRLTFSFSKNKELLRKFLFNYSELKFNERLLALCSLCLRASRRFLLFHSSSPFSPHRRPCGKCRCETTPTSDGLIFIITIIVRMVILFKQSGKITSL